MLSRVSVALLAALVALAVYGGGTSSLVLAYGAAGGPALPAPNLTNHTIGDNDNETVGLWFELNNDGSCGVCGGMMEPFDDFISTIYNDEWLVNWQSGMYPFCVGADYEIRWSTVSGTLTGPPSSGSVPLPEDTWSFSEWAEAVPLCSAGFAWDGIFGVESMPGPEISQDAAAANATIEVEIRSIDLSVGPATAQITFTP